MASAHVLCYPSLCSVLLCDLEACRENDVVLSLAIVFSFANAGRTGVGSSCRTSSIYGEGDEA